MFSIVSFTLGPVMTNTYLIADDETGESVVIDPADEGDRIVAEAEKRNWRIGSIWLTHAHFDHIGGTGALVSGSREPLPVALHASDMPLWKMKGGGPLFGVQGVDTGPRPSIDLLDGQTLTLGSRTDLPGGNYQTLIESIEQKVLTLPDETRLLNGHGPETTVGRERVYNPFLS